MIKKTFEINDQQVTLYLDDIVSYNGVNWRVDGFCFDDCLTLTPIDSPYRGFDGKTVSAANVMLVKPNTFYR